MADPKIGKSQDGKVEIIKNYANPCDKLLITSGQYILLSRLLQAG